MIPAGVTQLWVEGTNFGSDTLDFNWVPDPDDCTANYHAPVDLGVIFVTVPEPLGCYVNPYEVNVAPVATDDYISGAHSDWIFGNIALNDYDPNGDGFQVTVVDEPSHGTIWQRKAELFDCNDGDFTYVPKAGFAGVDTFTYFISDGRETSETVTVHLDVLNSPPTVFDDFHSIHYYESSLTGNVLSNDHDPDGDSLRAELVQSPQHGELRLLDDGSFTYIADSNYSGSDSFVYNVLDGVNGAERSATTTIWIEGHSPIDIDGRDSAADSWLNEDDESDHGIAVSTGSPAYLRLNVDHTSLDPSLIEERSISWDPTYLSINGNTTGALSLDSAGSGEELAITQILPGFDSGSVEYLVASPQLGQNPLVQQIAVSKSRSYLYEVDITSEHGLLVENTTDVLSASGFTYPEIEYKHGLQGSQGDVIPITHTWDSFLEASVRFRSSEIDVGTPFRIMGLSPTEDGFGFYFLEDGVGVQRGHAEADVTSSVKLPKEITQLNRSIEWFLLIDRDGDGNWDQDPLVHITTEHEIFLTAAIPAATGTQNTPTYIRMKQSVGYVDSAVSGTAHDWDTNPTWARVVYNTLKHHKFNLGVNAGDYAKGNDEDARFWITPETWDEAKIPGKGTGSDCISGAAWGELVTKMVGIPGKISAKRISAKSYDDHLTPHDHVTYPYFESYTSSHGNEYRRKLDLIIGGLHNNFEGTFIYETDKEVSPGKNLTFYIAVGTGSGSVGNAVYEEEKTVLRVFQFIAWKAPKTIYGTPNRDPNAGEIIEQKEYPDGDPNTPGWQRPPNTKKLDDYDYEEAGN
ncbi:MAG: Ig-like domain-containing protein [Pirellulaceae bacterium]